VNPVIIFLVLIFFVTLIVAWWLVRPLLRVGVTDDTSASRNVEALQVESRELTRDHRLGLLNDASFSEATSELERRVLHEAQAAGANTMMPRYKKTAITVLILLPIFALTSYLAIGTPQGILPELARPAAAQAESQMDELFRVAEEKLKAEPNDAKGWYLLARAKASVGQFEGAIAAYEKVVALTPTDSDAWADFADAAAGKSEGKMAGKPMELVGRALALDAKQPKALLLRGTHEIQVNQLDAAAKTFTLAKSVVDPTTGFAQIADNALKDIAARGGPAAVADSSSSTSVSSTEKTKPLERTTTVANAPLLRVATTLAASAKSAVATDVAKGNAAVFLIIRAAGVDRGPPLAAKKLTLDEFTQPVVFTANDAMVGAAGLASGAEVSVTARLSISGQPTPQAGDWQSTKQTVKLGSNADTALVIDQRVVPN
jgi:cytochrome c-type biogenesis protein CcmH